MSVKTVFIRTAADGSYTYERNFEGVIYGIEILVGDLSTPDIAITDGVYTTNLLTVTGLAASAIYQPGKPLTNSAGTALQAGTSINADAPTAVMGTLKIAVTGGGDTKKGSVRILYQ